MLAEPQASAGFLARAMNDKLRKWLESRCRMRPDGTWLAEVPVLKEPAIPSFVLPDEASKEAYLARAVQLGRVRFAFVLLLLASTIPLLLLSLLGPPDGGVLHALRRAAGPWVLLLLLLSTLVPCWMGRRLRRWLERVGTAAGESHLDRAGGGLTDGEPSAGRVG
jgi:hypothetical protein